MKGTLAFIKNSERAIGTVTELVELNESDGPTYLPIFVFTTKNNEEVTYRHDSSSAPPSWKIGEQVLFAYDPNNPTDTKILTYANTFNWTVLLMCFSLSLIIYSGAYFLSQPYLR